MLLEIARGLGQISAAGFQPDRTIRLCSWDGEEYGLLGSTAYAMAHKDELYENCVAYLNSDIGVAGEVRLRMCVAASCNLLSALVCWSDAVPGHGNEGGSGASDGSQHEEAAVRLVRLHAVSVWTAGCARLGLRLHVLHSSPGSAQRRLRVSEEG